MLDPLYIKTLDHKDKTTSTYSTKYKVPDRLGVYKFQITYWRYGYTFLNEETEVSIIPFRHDEFPRFLNIAYPYYFTTLTTMAATFIFIAFFLYSDFPTSVAKAVSSSNKSKHS